MHQKEKRSMDHFAGLDVSVKETSVCIVDDTGRIIRATIQQSCSDSPRFANPVDGVFETDTRRHDGLIHGGRNSDKLTFALEHLLHACP
jgi:hypothetical protein